jgi:deoxycytidylate deaminase
MGNQVWADTIILGFTGSIGSGCTFIAKGIAAQYGFKYYSLSNVLREIAKGNGISSPTIEQLQDLGNELRYKMGKSYLVKKLIDSISEDDSGKGIIIDSIKNDEECRTLKQFPFFYLFSVHADESVRSCRTIKAKKFKKSKEFARIDSRDKAEEIHYGQQVIKCNYLADIIINNNKNIPQQAAKDKKQFINEIHNKYISLIELKQKGRITPDNLPTNDETMMTMAYAESKKSSCLKRKVGSLIVSVENGNSRKALEHSINENVHILSSGYNEVPMGSVPCIFNKDYERCYRDFLQEEQAKSISYCPACGKKIKLPKTKCKSSACNFQSNEYIKVCPECKNELDIKYICPKCNTKVFKKFLTSVSNGKLLDMCRALHAEEHALLHLTKITGQTSDNLVLYTTTYPCNLCANKIVAAGIKKVVYADPYPMKEAKKILESGSVETAKFQGIKSSAFFRLYS